MFTMEAYHQRFPYMAAMLILVSNGKIQLNTNYRVLTKF